MMAVLDVDSEAEFDKKISSAGDALVIIDYSTTWCGPCKVSTECFCFGCSRLVGVVPIVISVHKTTNFETRYILNISHVSGYCSKV